MIRLAGLAVCLGVLTATSAVAADPVPVKGSQNKFAPTVTVMVGDKPVELMLTGVGLRTKVGLNVYAIGSYLQEGAAARTPEDLAKADAVRMLHLVMERNVEPADFIDAFKSAVGKSYPADKFATEFAQLTEAVGKTAAKKGDQVILLFAPGTGMRIQIVGKVDLLIKNADFAQALWEVYLGPKPLDEKMKMGLVARLAR
jgi:hypothetical protein